MVDFVYPDLSIASARLRCAMPAKWLYDHGHEAGDLLIVGKHLWPYDFTEGYRKYIFDVCDNHFHTDHEDHYRRHCDRATLVTCNSDVMKEIILEETGREAMVIPDPFELPRQSPHINDRLLWFGNKWNYKPVEKLDLSDYELTVVSEPFNESVIPWSLDNLKKALWKCGIVIIPVTKSKAKSANRMIEAINAGCFVVAEDLPAYREFNMWVGDIREGIEWALDNEEEALERVIEDQEYIDKHYSIDAIGPLWEKAVEWVTQTN